MDLQHLLDLLAGVQIEIAGHYLPKLKMHIPQDPASSFLRETLSQVKNKSHVQECSNSCSQLQTT